MKKTFEIIGVISLMIASFYYSSICVSVVKEYDDIMILINQNKEKYEKESKNAKVEENTIIPGIKGVEVDISKSYEKMKKINEYNESFIQLKDKKPEISISNIYDKFVISGNKEKKEVTLIFLALKNRKVDKILSILKHEDVSANFFIDFYFYEEEVVKKIAINHDIGNLSLNYDYNDSSFSWLTTKIKKVKDKTYCYSKDKDIDILNLCASLKLHTITPSLEIKERPFYQVKNNVENGSIFSFYITPTLENELSTILKYLKSKNYNIVSLSTMLEE